MPTDEQRALWAAIRAHPDDDTPRLVYADWLQEHDDEPRAEFIRVQCALAQLGSDRRKGRKQRPALEASEKGLIAAHREGWAVPFREQLKGGKRWDSEDRWLQQPAFRRGFLDGSNFELATLALLAATGDELEPIDRAEVTDCLANYDHNRVVLIGRWPGGGCVTGFSIAGATDQDIAAIVRPGYMTNLRRIGFWFGAVSDDGIEELAGWASATRLRSLDLQQNLITDRGALALTQSPYLSNLFNLNLHRTHIGPRGRERLRERFGDALRIESET